MSHGSPLAVWQLDFSVYNGPGKWLDHLTARHGMESEWPQRLIIALQMLDQRTRMRLLIGKVVSFTT